MEPSSFYERNDNSNSSFDTIDTTGEEYRLCVEQNLKTLETDVNRYEKFIALQADFDEIKDVKTKQLFEDFHEVIGEILNRQKAIVVVLRKLDNIHNSTACAIKDEADRNYKELVSIFMVLYLYHKLQKCYPQISSLDLQEKMVGLLLLDKVSHTTSSGDP